MSIVRNMFIIWRRELASFFLSPIAYVVTIVFLGVCGFMFLSVVFDNEGGSETLPTMLATSMLICMTFPISAVTMRLFAEEKRLGTLESLMAAPVTETGVVLGKYGAAFSFLLIMLAPAAGFLFALERLSPGLSPADVDIGGFAGACVILFLLCAFYTSVGLVISLLTRHQVVAGMCAMCCVWGLILLGWIVSVSPVGDAPWVDYISVLTHVEDFARGSISAGPVFLYVSSTVFMLFTGIRLLESRRWL